MSTDKMREEFQKWLLYVRGLESEWQTERNCFKDYAAHLAFQSWRDSRAAIEVGLPPSPYMPDSDPDSMSGYEIGEAQGRCDMWAACREAIESLGLKVTP